MRNSWARAWLAATVLLVGASAIARTRHTMLLRAEEPVLDWLTDGTDLSGWGRAAKFGSPALIIFGTLALIGATFFVQRRAAIAVLVTTLFAALLSTLVSRVVDRPAPASNAGTSSFPSDTIVHTGVFWGLVVLIAWWVGAPKLLWQVLLELAVFVTLLVTIHLVLSGQIWPSDAVGSVIIIAVSLIMAAIVLEGIVPQIPERLRKLRAVSNT